ncbi:hypothetical protein [Goodfellowiella coeruleoviolacea]|uniref:Uncharacterized protein n=1 Tax=Goodfellowiella coeruleoviolacea TaxID=334858 RepID=A0AAE3GH77_9PSEU|nr:hypothetical protein [Goodfellowiella coeruleoviolacea]MCP2167307.1 hypothetical protein [Goodfellowiella coeruleoviolacea]
MTTTLIYGHSTFATPRVHGWLPDKPGFHRALCGIQLADTLITTYPRPTRDNATWCAACYLVTQHTPGGTPLYVMRRSALDGAAHIIAAGEVNQGRSYRAVCGHGLSDDVAKPVPAYACDACLITADELTRQEASPT